MFLLITYVLIALVFSFLCSIAESVLLSITSGYIAVIEKEGKPHAKILKDLKENISQPLAAILTLNTITHTVGAAGAGAQAMLLFGSAALGIASAIMTFLILVFSEIIPKTLGAHYWEKLAPMTVYFIRYLVWLLYPFVKLSDYLTRSMTVGPVLTGINREELAALAEQGWQEGQLAKKESSIMVSLLSMDQINVVDATTPNTVLFSIPENITIKDYFNEYGSESFSRIPVYGDSPDDITGFVLRSDLLHAMAAGDVSNIVTQYKREMVSVNEMMPLSKVMDNLLHQRTHIMLVVDEYGSVRGILTLEDALETMLGLEIVDESDNVTDMQELARRFWRIREKNRSKTNLNPKEQNHEQS
ncbi:MAG: CBS domain containing-hemolysin-like protein [Planctomycetota bacterium]|jgi:CBS domain containing-hemolysin-like protein